MKFDRKKDINPKYLLLALSIICLILLFLSVFWGERVRPLREFVGKIITPMQEGVNDIGEWFGEKMEIFGDVKELKKKNAELQDELNDYKQEVDRYQAELQELEELRSLYELDSMYPEYNMTAARVFSTNSSSWFNEFYIDKGLNDGVYEECNVLCDNGLLGIVTESYDDYAKVRAIIDDRSNITAEITSTRSLCNVEGSLKTMADGYLLVTDIDKDADIAEGDKVTTSNVSDRYFYGLTIGYISEITMDSNNLTKTAKLIPAVDFTDVKDVLIITDRKQEVNY